MALPGPPASRCPPKNCIAKWRIISGSGSARDVGFPEGIEFLKQTATDANDAFAKDDKPKRGVCEVPGQSEGNLRNR